MTPAPKVDVTALVCTYNRKSDLLELLESAAAIDTGGEYTFEVLIIDNNSNDGTKEAIAPFIDGVRVRYYFEPRQGKSYALQVGLAETRGDVMCIVDSDEILPPNYLRDVYRTFRNHPEVSMVGGRVLPVYYGPVPRWLTMDHWGALAMCDYGVEPFTFDKARATCLLSACYRVEHIRNIGGFRAGLSVSKGQLGGVEDVDAIRRMLNAGYLGHYEPSMYIWHKVEPNRLGKAYHRRWHTDHGRFIARLNDPAVEGTGRKLFGIPGHMIREALRDASRWAVKAIQATDDTFLYETRCRYFNGFMRQRLSDHFHGAPATDERTHVGQPLPPANHRT